MCLELQDYMAKEGWPLVSKQKINDKKKLVVVKQ
jgi:hypothetical protein